MPGELGNEYEQPFVGYYEKRYDDHSDANTLIRPVSWHDIIPKNGQMKRILERLRKKKYKNKNKEI